MASMMALLLQWALASVLVRERSMRTLFGGAGAGAGAGAAVVAGAAAVFVKQSLRALESCWLMLLLLLL